MSHVLYRRSYPGPVYIHYGADHFDLERFKEIKNRPNWVKPEAHTGLWASPRNSERSWKTWVEGEHYGSDLTKSFEFRMSDPGKVFLYFRCAFLHAFYRALWHHESIRWRRLYPVRS